MKESQAKDLCMKLIKSDSEDEVLEILRSESLWEDVSLWRYYGDNENNFGVVGNQASSPDAALAEKLVNSIDARLTNECLVKAIDPVGSKAPQSIREAVAQFFDSRRADGTAGLISEWPDNKRKEVAKGITLMATGSGPKSGNPCITIVDIGEGQAPGMFPETFLSLSKSNKLRIPFVQGKFNQGGTGALQFCGKNNLQLIVSRRNPRLVNRKLVNSSESHWGFTIVRRESPADGRRNSVFTYLAPIDFTADRIHGKVLHFSAENMPIFPQGNKAYEIESEWGSLIKLYEYSLSGYKTHILRKGGLLARLDLLLPNPALPIRLHECRTIYRGHEGSFDTTLSGIQVRLDEDKKENIEEGFPTTSSMNVAGEQFTAKIYALKKGKAETYRKNEGVVFILNGQTHGSLTADFFRREKVGLSYLADSILVLVDCSKLTIRNREDLIMNSRERLRKSDLRAEIESTLEELLRNNQLLRDLKERRRREMKASQIDDARPLEEVLKSLLSKYPTLSALFLEGKRISNPFKTIEVSAKEGNFEGRTYPTYFKFKGKEYGSELLRECHINMRCRIAFETDASNNYFDRDIDPGENSVLIVNGDTQLPASDYSLNLQNGIAVLNFRLPSGTVIGDKVNALCVVNDVTQLRPFENRFCITIKKPADITPSKGSRRNPATGEQGKDREIPAGIDLPKIIEVREAEWSLHNPPFDKFTALVAKNAGFQHSEEELDECTVYDFYVNMDNIFLNTELKAAASKEDLDIILARFKYGLVLIGLGLLQQELTEAKKNDSSQENENDGEQENNGKENLEDRIEKVSQAIAPILLPLINSLGAIDSEDLHLQEYSAEQT